MDQILVIALQLGVLWVAFFGLLLVISRKWANGFARWSLKTLRSVIAYPFLLIGRFIRG